MGSTTGFVAVRAFESSRWRGGSARCEESAFGASPEPEMLEVRAGRLGRRLLLIPVEQVERIVPEERWIMLRASPERVGTIDAEND
jgi:hypothetical protein